MLKAFQQQLEDTDTGETDDEEEEIEELSQGDESYEEDFEDREIDHDLTFKSFCKRLSCFAHTLQLVVNKFSDDDSVAATMKRAHTFVKKVNTVYLLKIRQDKKNYCRVLPKQLEIKLQNSYRNAKVPNN